MVGTSNQSDPVAWPLTNWEPITELPQRRFEMDQPLDHARHMRFIAPPYNSKPWDGIR